MKKIITIILVICLFSNICHAKEKINLFPENLKFEKEYSLIDKRKETEYILNNWDKEETILATTFTIATFIDWGQTRYIVKNKKDNCVTYDDGSWYCKYGYYERTNIYLGKDPSIGEVDTYMPIAIIGTLTIAHILPKENKYLLGFIPIPSRKNFLYGMSFLEIGTIYNNYKINIKVNF